MAVYDRIIPFNAFICYFLNLPYFTVYLLLQTVHFPLTPYEGSEVKTA